MDCTNDAQRYLCVVVRRNKLYIVLIHLLGIGLLFNQVGLNFFHNKHDAHESYRIQNDKDQFHSHGQHCKVCSLDTLFHLYFEASPEFHFYQPEETVVAIQVLAKVIGSRDFIKGRAPPYLIS